MSGHDAFLSFSERLRVVTPGKQSRYTKPGTSAWERPTAERPGPGANLGVQTGMYYQRWATSMTSRLVLPGPVITKVLNGSRARTPSPKDDCPSKLPKNAT